MDLVSQFHYGKLIGIKGERATIGTLLISMSVKLQEKGKVLYIDTANSFNPFFVERNYYKNTKLLLKQIMIARPFTVSQLRKTVHNLKNTIPENSARAIIISDFDRLFYDEDVHEKDIEFMLEDVLDQLDVLTKRHDILTIIGLSTLKNDRSEKVNQLIQKRLAFYCEV